MQAETSREDGAVTEAPVVPLGAPSHPLCRSGAALGMAEVALMSGQMGTLALQPSSLPQPPSTQEVGSHGDTAFLLGCASFYGSPSTMLVILQTCPAVEGGQEHTWLPVLLNGLNGCWAHS